MARATNRAVFVHAMLPDARPRWDLFSAGFGLQCVALAALLIIPLLLPQKLQLYQRYWTTPIEAPPIVAWKPQPPPPAPKPAKIKQPVVAKEVPKPVVVDPPKPKIINPVFSSPVVKPATAKKNTPAPSMPEVSKAFPPPTPTVSLGSSAMPTLRKPREEVQTGGFGDPNGVPTNNRPGIHAPNIAQQGGFDMPTGPGYGNGTGGAKGARGVVASSGFGNGVATPVQPSSHGSVQQGVFADEHATAAPKVKPAASTAPKTSPVEILFKPKPVYSDIARAKKIEGEVLLQVVFTGSGDVKVERVVQGLGYGLDESAENAARQIRFKPAEANGQPVDSTAIVHITFQLAN
jgi:periplasmic protein TonB